MSQKFNVGEVVTWSSQAGGHKVSKTGTVVEKVRPFNGPQTKGIRLERSDMTRDHESYIVEVTVRNKKKIYWPLVKNLTLLLPSTSIPSKPVQLPVTKITPARRKLVTHFVLCIDRSGSMYSLQQNVIDAFNKNCDTIRDGAVQNGQEATITLVTFGNDVKTVYQCRDTLMVTPLDRYNYTPAGNTPLFDAVGLTAEALEKRTDAKDNNVSFVFIIITDGQENFSATYNASKLNVLMKRLQKTDHWSFAFLVPPGEKNCLRDRFQIPEGNISEWEASAAGVERYSKDLHVATQSFYDTRAAGQTSTKGFFVTDLNLVSTRDVQSKLTNVRSQVTVLDVNKRVEISKFIQDELNTNYIPGKAFYQLMKDEKVQPTKKVMLRDRDTGSIYAGNEARDLLGLPTDLEVKVRPGDHSKWDVFVQSTSTNRRLVPGTQLVYLN